MGVATRATSKANKSLAGYIPRPYPCTWVRHLTRRHPIATEYSGGEPSLTVFTISSPSPTPYFNNFCGYPSQLRTDIFYHQARGNLKPLEGRERGGFVGTLNLSGALDPM